MTKIVNTKEVNIHEMADGSTIVHIKPAALPTPVLVTGAVVTVGLAAMAYSFVSGWLAVPILIAGVVYYWKKV